MNEDEASFDLLSAGAGPAGCTTALYFGQRGYRVAVLEAEADLPIDLRGSTLHPPSLDLLESLGVTQRILPLGLVSPIYQHRDRRSGAIASFDLSLLAGETRHPYRLQCEQFKLTRVVCEMLKQLPNVDVLFAHSVTGVTQDSKGVTATVKTAGGTQQLRARYLLGSDGASSVVRKSIGVEFEGFTYPERFLVVSTPFDFAAVFPQLANVNYISDPDEWCVLLKTVTLWRVLVPTRPEQDDEFLLSEENVQDRLQHLYRRPVAYEIGHRTLYRVHQRVASTYRVGKVVLAGDAAHINNPLGGMGMNGGLHDAFNLCEKLLAVFEGRAGDDYLDLYDRQRRTVAQQFVQEQSIRNKELMEAKDPDLQRKRQAELMHVANDPVLAKKFLLKSSMIQSLRDSAAIQ